MKKLLFLCFLVICYHAPAAQTKTKKAVFIILDGIPADVIDSLELPNLKAIAMEGGYAHCLVGGEKGGYSQTPTISAVGYNSVLTGTWVNKHQVWDNDVKAPNYHYKNIFRLLKESNFQKKMGIFSTWQDNRTKLVGEGLPKAGNIQFDYKFDGLELDTVNYPHDTGKKYIQQIDKIVVDTAAAFIAHEAPDVSWVYLEYTDDMGHKYGDSPQFYASVLEADGYAGKIWKAVRYRQKYFDEDWLVIITTDHGRDSKTGQGHGGQSARERSGWIVTNAKNLNERFKQNKAAIVDIMPTIARFMGLHIPDETEWEIDGVPLTGNLSLADAEAEYKNNEAIITWKAYEPSGTVKIFLATTNNFKSGGKDEYQFVKEVPVMDQRATIDLKHTRSPFYKFYLQGKSNGVSRWITRE